MINLLYNFLSFSLIIIVDLLSISLIVSNFAFSELREAFSAEMPYKDNCSHKSNYKHKECDETNNEQTDDFECIIRLYLLFSSVVLLELTRNAE